MEQLSIIQGWLEPVFEKHNVQLYSLQFNKGKMILITIPSHMWLFSFDSGICTLIRE